MCFSCINLLHPKTSSRFWIISESCMPTVSYLGNHKCSWFPISVCFSIKFNHKSKVSGLKSPIRRDWKLRENSICYVNLKATKIQTKFHRNVPMFVGFQYKSTGETFIFCHQFIQIKVLRHIQNSNVLRYFRSESYPRIQTLKLALHFPFVQLNSVMLWIVLGKRSSSKNKLNYSFYLFTQRIWKRYNQKIDARYILQWTNSSNEINVLN